MVFQYFVRIDFIDFCENVNKRNGFSIFSQKMSTFLRARVADSPGGRSRSPRGCSEMSTFLQSLFTVSEKRLLSPSLFRLFSETCREDVSLCYVLSDIVLFT